ncbi:MAG: GH92 family glycosyl hydrolase [Acidobacteria bacterium]|nr:GH92 family glycosyl hydrolase [Acidobacteriota bacterium]
MMDRRGFIQLASFAATQSVLGTTVAHAASERAAEDLTRWVDPIIGTGGHGHTYPGATVPFGAVQFSPDTYNKQWDAASGYHRDDTSIMGFSHTHLSGTGVGDMLDLLLVPRTGAVKLEPGTREHPEEGYRSRFDHKNEHAEPGYYSVKMQSAGGKQVQVELSATGRTGIARIHFPEGEEPHILLDWYHVYGTNNTVTWADLRVDDEQRISGGRGVDKWTPKREIYFATEFSQRPKKIEVFAEGKPVDSRRVSGIRLQVALHFEPGSTVLVKSGISIVSAKNARLNLDTELPGWNFDAVRTAANRKWQAELAKIVVEDADAERKKIFYTGLYHMMCAPTLNDDVNGEYRGLDKQVHTLAKGEHNYSTFSLWDTYRALHPSFTLWQRERVAPMVNCLIRIAEQSIYGFPIWPLQDGETYCMPGYHAASVMAEACVKKVPGIDWQRAYRAMRKRNMDDDYMGLPIYRRVGFIPADREKESVGKVIEYMYCDWATSQVAEHVGAHVDAKIQRKRSQSYKKLFDAKTQFIRARLTNGDWTPNFDPKATGYSPAWRDYCESNAWQSTFGVQHDVKGYMHLFGGREAFARRLDALFTEPFGVTNENVMDMTGYIGQYVHGNEPSHHIAYLYLWAGQPWKTQERVQQILETLYHAAPDGLSGNEDCGQMSAWFCMSAMGLYAVDPASGTYVLNAPLFNRVTVKLGGGKKLVIGAKRSSHSDKYVHGVTLNGKPHDRLWVHHSELVDGAHLLFHLGAEPNKSFAVSETAMPPSLTA